jgi:hypothetical protein
MPTWPVGCAGPSTDELMARLYGPGPQDPPPLVSTQDLAGLRTVDVEDRPVGALFGALSEQPTGLIRYLDVELDKAGKHVLVPIGHARINTEGLQPKIKLRAATYEDLLSVPDYPGDANGLHGEFHESVLEVYGRLFYGDRYYAHPSFDHDALYAGESPIVSAPGTLGPVPDDVAPRAVQPLSGLEGMRMARPDLDVRGRTLLDAAGDVVGEVVDLLVEPPSRRPRYAVVQLDDPPRRTVLPIGYLEPVDDADRLRVRSLTHADIRLLPASDGPLTREDENRVHAAIEGRLTGERLFYRPDFRR